MIHKGGPALTGYVGCIRGLKIGNYLVDLPNQISENELGVKAGCVMKCDEDPCKHQGICIEDFENGKHYCDCEHTSYYGETCNEGKRKNFLHKNERHSDFSLQVKIYLAFKKIHMNLIIVTELQITDLLSKIFLTANI